MTKVVNGVFVKLQSYNNSNKQDNVSNNTSARNRELNSSYSNAENHADSHVYEDNSHRHLNRLKQAIVAGRFTINSTRVAEKLIQFETQLST